MKSTWWIILILSCAAMPANAQRQMSAAVHPETGRPFMTTFNPKEIGGHPQTWDMLQDLRGIMYAGNGLGLLEFDGSEARLIDTPSKSVVRSVGMDDDGNIYAGSSHDFGYLEADSVGDLRLVSLLSFLTEEEKSFNDVWTTIATPDGIYFQTRERLFRFKRGASKKDWTHTAWEPEPGGRFMYSFWLDGSYYVHQGGVGMMKLVDDQLELLPGGERFADVRTQVMTPFIDADKPGPTGKYLVVPFTGGLFTFDGDKFEPFHSEAEDLLESAAVYKGVTLPNGTFALGTLAGGLFIIDKQGELLLHLDDQSGFPSNTVMAVTLDRQGTLWVATEGGISLLETPSPLSRYTADNGLRGFVSEITRFNGTLYVTTTQGVYFLDPEVRAFRAVVGMEAGGTQSWYFEKSHGQLLVATQTGLYSVVGDHVAMVRPNTGDNFNTTRLHQSKQDPNLLWVGLRDGLAAMRWEAGRWVYVGRVLGVDAAITHIVEERPGELWLGFISQGLKLMKLNGPDLASATLEDFGSTEGLPEGGVSVFEVAGKPVFATKDGIFRYDETNRTFTPDSVLAAVSFGGSQEEYSFEEDYLGNVWINLGRESALLRRLVDGSYLKEQTPLLRFADVPASAIYSEDDGVVWFGSDGLVVRFDPRVPKNYALDYTALVRKVTAKGNEVVYGGAPGDRPVPRLDADRNAIRFVYAAPTFEAPRATRYETFLEGFDEGWSDWTSENRRDYTNLPGGDYTFRVKAKNIYEHVSKEASYEIIIRRPWYTTWWAWVLYVIGGGLVVFGLIRIRTGQLEARGEELEREVQERTAELQKQKERIEEAYENVDLLSRVGRDITASLETKAIIDTVYESVNNLMDAAVFGIGLYDPQRETIDFPATKEKGQTLPAFSYDMNDEKRLAVWCLKNRKEIFINDYGREYAQYITEDAAPLAGEDPESILYLPLLYKDDAIGVITAQSFRKHAYSDYHLNILSNLATYTAIALDNAQAYRRLNETLEHLRLTQEQLITQEKLASLGALTGGIAHEIKNPLNFITNFAEVNKELADELEAELSSKRDSMVSDIYAELEDILSNLKINAAQINHHGKRADGIVRSMMQHASGALGERQPVDVNELVEEYVNLSYHGMRANVTDFNVTIVKELEENLGSTEMVPQDIGRVLLNLLNNAFYAVNKHVTNAGSGYEPTVTVQTRRSMGGIEITVADNGPGMPKEVQERIFEPFFTTKPTGSGTGLGLSLSYEIVTQGHGGSIHVVSHEGSGASFTVTLPVS